MRSRWEGVRADLLRSVTTLQAEQQFNQIDDAALERFTSPSALVAHLNDSDGNRDEKDRIYGVLVEAVQCRVAWSELATAILWLGLWSRLDGLYRWRLRDFLPEPDELVATIGFCFTAVIGRADLTRIRRMAATLSLNTKRDLTQALKRRWAETRRRADLPEDDQLAGQREVEPAFIASGGTEEQEIAALRARLIPIVGTRDIDLVLAVVLGETQKEAGARLGLSHEVSRKRYGRALDKIRAFENEVVPFPPRKVRL
jgi:hypothetical protein